MGIINRLLSLLFIPLTLITSPIDLVIWILTGKSFVITDKFYKYLQKTTGFML
jgi:hypothetical protein